MLEESKELKEAQKRCWNYDPSDEEVDAKYDDDFDKEIQEMIEKRLKE